ncbi:hypothetical protein NSTC745_05692 [Nostoc sp. DSM 114161]|jgi:hypothetical protein|uniref:hypothetical protein n=1 Tax=Nostoc sp. DSM 114161 TaxID=3440143 RepID=UPI004045308D
MALKDKEDTRKRITAEDWKRKYIPKDTLMKQKYEELSKNPAALAEYLVKEIARNVRTEMSTNR